VIELSEHWARLRPQLNKPAMKSSLVGRQRWFRVVVAGLLQMLVAQLDAEPSQLFTASADTLKLDLVELRKLGVGTDQLLRHIRLLVDGARRGALGDCLDRAAAASPSAGDRPSPAASAVAPVADGQLHRHFVRNKTVTCNDGSKAGYFTYLLTPGFQPYVSVLHICFRNRFLKNRVRIAVP